MGDSASLLGGELLRHDFTIEQVVHDYGDLCQSITELAVEQAAPITAHEFGLLNIRLDSAIAGAVTEYARQREMFRADVATATNERLGALGHEMRNLLNTAILAISAIKRGSVGFGGATAAALDRSLIGMRALIDRTLAEVRLEEGSASFNEVIEIGPFIADVQVAAALEATHNDCHVVLRAYAAGRRVLIEIEDDGAGLPAGTAEQLVRPFERYSADPRGMGMRLSISRKAVEAIGGKLLARDIAGTGCVFTIDLPQKQWAA